MVIMQQPPEITVAYLFTEHLAKGPRLMEMTIERGNMFKALARVRGNKGAPGIDKMTVDMDLSKFFDRVNHDRLMSRLAGRIKDKRVLKLIRKYLTAGTMIDGLVTFSTEGTPQGGPLSPLLSNIVLDELDKELEKRGLRFVRYADDFVIYLKSKKAANRVMESITHFITAKLKLQVNQEGRRRAAKAPSEMHGGANS